MADSRFPIPEQFRYNVHYVESLDKRSEEAILESLTQHVPITSEKNIWGYWDSGVRKMPNWCQRNVVNWIRLCGPSWTIRILDNVPNSPNNALTWVGAEMLPNTFVDGTMDGPYTGPHSADFLRGACIFLFGGVWMDTGIVLIRKIEDICWKQLEDPSSPYEVSVPWMYGQVMANHFVAGRKGNMFIKYWHDIFIHLWEGRTNPGGIITNPLVAFGKDIDFEASKARNFHWDFIVDPITVIEYIGQVLAWLRLCMIHEPNNGFNGREYWASKVLIFDSLTEDWAAEDTVGFTGKDLFNALATKRNADPASMEYQIAHKMTWRMLTKASMQKITHGKNLTKTPALGVLWDMEENEGKDVEPGSFAELLRYGSVHFEQDRKEIDYVKAEKSDIVLKEKMLQD